MLKMMMMMKRSERRQRRRLISTSCEGRFCPRIPRGGRNVSRVVCIPVFLPYVVFVIVVVDVLVVVVLHLR